MNDGASASFYTDTASGRIGDERAIHPDLKKFPFMAAFPDINDPPRQMTGITDPTPVESFYIPGENDATNPSKSIFQHYIRMEVDALYFIHAIKYRVLRKQTVAGADYFTPHNFEGARVLRPRRLPSFQDLLRVRLIIIANGNREIYGGAMKWDISQDVRRQPLGPIHNPVAGCRTLRTDIMLPRGGAFVIEMQNIDPDGQPIRVSGAVYGHKIYA